MATAFDASAVIRVALGCIRRIWPDAAHPVARSRHDYLNSCSQVGAGEPRPVLVS